LPTAIAPAGDGDVHGGGGGRGGPVQAVTSTGKRNVNCTPLETGSCTLTSVFSADVNNGRRTGAAAPAGGARAASAAAVVARALQRRDRVDGGSTSRPTSIAT